MPCGSALYGIFLGHIFCKYGGVGVVRTVFMFQGDFQACKGSRTIRFDVFRWSR